jgi:hypothetical protein
MIFRIMQLQIIFNIEKKIQAVLQKKLTEKIKKNF